MRKIIYTLIAISFTNLFFGQVQTYHDTQGKLEVTNSGQATYTLPIALPPSIQDVGPTINLVYASGQTGGIAGQGWNISGISTINRVASRKDIDGFVDGVDFDDNDKLALDGQRLLLKTGTYWGEGSTYETEIQSNLKIELTGTGINTMFVVTAQDGSKSWYARSYVGSGVVANELDSSFYIKKYEDTNGNIIEYRYMSYAIGGIGSYPKLYINEIVFGKNSLSNPSHFNKIKFNYIAANRIETVYVKGVKLDKTHNLKSVEVYTNLPNDALFRKYDLTYYPTDGLGYDRLQKITEYNGTLEAANPVEFEYDMTISTNVNSEIRKSFTNNINFNGVKLSGDFDGDGTMDVVVENKLYTKLFEGTTNNVAGNIPFITAPNKLFTGINSTVYDFPGVPLEKRINQYQSIINPNEQQNNINFEVYTRSITPEINVNGANLRYQKSIDFNNTLTINQYQSNLNYTVSQLTAFPGENQPAVHPTLKKSNEYFEGDFNGDGLSEVLIYKTINERYYFKTVNYDGLFIAPYTHNYTQYIDDGEECFLVSLEENASNSLGSDGYIAIQNSNLLNGDKKFMADFNGDGKTDVLAIIGTNYKVVTLKQLTVSPWIELEVIGQGNLDEFTSTKQILFGDYNGDGKTDIMLPDTEGGVNHTLWHIYYSNPKTDFSSFFIKQSLDIVEYWPNSTIQDPGYYNDQVYLRNYYSMDVNKDGKSDVVQFIAKLYRPDPIFDNKNWDSYWMLKTFVNNIGNTTNSSFNLDYTNPCVSYGWYNDCEHFDSMPWVPIGMPSNFKNNGLDNDFIVLRESNNTVTYTNFSKDFSRDNNIKKITQSGGAIIDEIEYLPMEQNNSNFYNSDNGATYPLIEINGIPSLKLVSKIKNTSLGVVKYQDFKYNGYITDIEKKGAIGFRKNARSSWYRTNSDKKIWQVVQLNPYNRGAILNTYSQILDGSVSFSFTNNAINPSTISGLISKTENTYFPPSTDSSSKKYTLLLQNQKITDYITNVINETVYEYSTDGYNLPSSVISKNYLGTTLQGTTTTTTLFDNVTTDAGSGYYIGRPTETTTTVTAYGNSHTTNEKLFYTNGNIIRKEKKVGTTAASIATATETLIEVMDYFPNGNLKLKTISSSGFPVTVPPIADRTVSYTYDPTNRFIKTTTDTEGLVTTNDSYHPLYGLPLSQTNNTLAQTTTSIYDNWGKRTKVTDFLGKYIDYIYTKSNNIYRTTENGSDGSSSYIENDALSRVIKKATKNINNVWSYTSIEYDWLGRKYRESEPYFETETPKWNTISYDDYSRPSMTYLFTLKFIVNSYDGLTTTTNDGILIKTTTKNSNGHLVSSSEVGVNGEESGGTITYTYNALGNLLTSVYDGSTVSMQYDLWGRKTSINDPSAGLYSYIYNAYGEILKETSPKGFTDYTYTPTGKILTKWVKDAVTPLNTNIKTTYNYDATYKWISSMSIVNPFDGNSTYAYTYDIGTANGFTNTKQLKKTIETLTPTGAGTVTFTKDLSFDGFGRVLTETSTAAAHGKTSTKVITNSYINGELYQIFDGATATGTPIWKANTLNSRGQLLTGSLGNGINISNEYDQYGYPKKIKHDKLGTNPLNITTLEYTFTPSTGNLEERRNTNVFERNFTLDLYNYDSLDRLDGNAFVDYNYYNFDNGYDGFSPIGSCFLSNVNGKLKVVLENATTGVEKLIKTVSKADENIQIEFEMTPFEDCNQFTPFLCNNADLRCSLYEKDPSTGAINVLGDNLAVEMNGSMFLTQNSNKNIYLKFYILQSNNGYSPKFKFTLDNVIYSIQPDDYTYQTYHNSGKINANYLGTYNYNKTTAIPPKPFQNTSVTLTDEGKAFYGIKSGQVISYNAIQRPIQITEGTHKIDFGYNTMQQRMVMYYGNANTNKTLRPYRKYYSADGSMEINYTLAVTTTPTAPAKVEFFTYIGGDAYSAPIVNRKIDSATSENFYLHRDYQGSILAITNSVGTVVEKRTFDAWGNITKVQDGVGNNLTKLTFFDRGYTGHEHLQAVGLINMNARLYDPKLRRFIQPDNFIQDPTNTQNFNRYAYCVNNPLKYTDKSGNIFHLPILASAIIIGAIIGGGMYGLMVVTGHAELSFAGAFQAVIMGGISGAVTSGIGTAVGTIHQFGVRISVQAVAHGLFQGGMAAAQGGKFWSSFAAGGVASLASSLWTGGSLAGGDGNWGGLGGKFADTAGGVMLMGTITGGAAARLTGGNFWQGAVTGLVVSGLNHAMHQMDSYDEITEDKNNSGKVRFKGFTNKELDEYRVALEEPIDNVTIITPKSDVTYDADGFYFENPTEDNYWFKIGDGKSVLVTPLRGDGRISFESRGLNFKISVLSYHSNYYNFFSDMGIRFKGEQDHWTINPFKLKK